MELVEPFQVSFEQDRLLLIELPDSTHQATLKLIICPEQLLMAVSHHLERLGDELFLRGNSGDGQSRSRR